MDLRQICLSLSVIACLTHSGLQAQDKGAETRREAQEEFARQRYSSSQKLLRTHLRAHPEDQDARVWLGASYYHTGEAQQALSILLKAKPTSELRSFRRFYLALCYDALGKGERARKLLQKQSESKDILAEDALFELTAIRYEDGDLDEARASLEAYRKRYPEGRYKRAIAPIEIGLSSGTRGDVAGSRRSAYRNGFFDSNPRALLAMPHSWFYELGYQYVRGERSNPGYREGLPIVQTGVAYEEYQLVAQGGLVLGPFKGQGTESRVGYIYSQNWFSDSERMQTFFDDPGDVQYFPFRPDLMERSHRLFVETEGTKGSFQFGAYGHWAYIRAGSTLFPAPERPEIRKAFDVGVQTLFVPWMKWNYNPKGNLLFYLDFEKQLNREQDDYSYKTYNFSSQTEEPFISFTLQNENRFDFLNLRLRQEFFKHRYLYNDYWESYETTGFAGQAQVKLGSFALVGAMAMSQDAFTSDVIRSTSCSDSSDEGGFGSGGGGITCARSDSITKFSFGGSYTNSSQQSFAAIMNILDRKNDKLIVYNEAKTEILLIYSHAFPTLSGVERYIEPFVGLADQRGVF